MRGLFTALALLWTGGAALAATFASPEEAVRAMEAAYARGDADAAVATRDFSEEARRMLAHISPALAGDPDILKDTAHTLELGYRQDMREKLFPEFKRVTCTITQVTYPEANLAKVAEDCTIPGKGVSKGHLYVFKSALGWRVITLADDS
jgi:hypothetical protein